MSRLLLALVVFACVSLGFDVRAEVRVPERPLPNLYSGEKPVDFAKMVKEKKSFIIQIFAPWCHYCKKEHPALVSLKNKRDDLEIYSIVYNPGMLGGTENGCAETRSFIKVCQGASTAEKGGSQRPSQSYPFTSIGVDESGTLSKSLTEGATTVPQTLLFKEGKFVTKMVGMLEPEELENKIAAVFPAPTISTNSEAPQG